MPKRISDILPKKEVKYFKEKKPSGVKFQAVEKKEEAKKIKEAIKKNKFQFFLFSKKFLISIFLLAFSGGFWLYFFLPNARIIISPKLETLTYKTNLIVDKATAGINSSDRVIPGQLIKEEKEISQDFPSSGKEIIENKAQGTIRIYNNYSTSSQILISGKAQIDKTRFISDSGKIFRLKEKTVVPGAKIEKGELVPSYIDAEVEADKAGEEYNIGPSIFSIPGFAGTPKYTRFYAESFSQMTGGFIGEKPQITKEDLEKAESSLNERILKEILDALKIKMPQDYILIDDAFQIKILETTFSAKSGENLALFNGKIKASSQGIIFRPSALESVSNQYIDSQIQKNLSLIEENKKVKEGSLKINYSVEKLETEKGKLFLNLEVNKESFTDLDLDLLRENLADKNRAEISKFFEDQPQIAKVEIKLWPFWVRKIPKNIEKIKIELGLAGD